MPSTTSIFPPLVSSHQQNMLASLVSPKTSGSTLWAVLAPKTVMIVSIGFVLLPDTQLLTKYRQVWQRPDFHSSPSISHSLLAALKTSGLTKDEIDLFDFYSFVHDLHTNPKQSLMIRQPAAFPSYQSWPATIFPSQISTQPNRSLYSVA